MSNTQSKIRARIAEWNKQPDIINAYPGAVKAVAINELGQVLEWLAEDSTEDKIYHDDELPTGKKMTKEGTEQKERS